MDQESQDWSFLVGKDGAEAVEIIKEKTGMIIERHFYSKIFSIFFRFKGWSHSAIKCSRHRGLSNRSD
jgi:hypothetical protein